MLAMPSRAIAPLQRVLVLALLAPALLLATLAAFPALVIIPFLSDGTNRTVSLLRAHAAYASALLTGSRSR
ncbi:dTMP kinase [Kitasatospora sp. NPDC048365]|uniref:dTMP kinase n=1 Tax=Kitasatospora sp. NPDC048365 TaxID=3364050 RepID=UPI00371CDDA8